jgi:hypothetical protein
MSDCWQLQILELWQNWTKVETEGPWRTHLVPELANRRALFWTHKEWSNRIHGETVCKCALPPHEMNTFLLLQQGRGNWNIHPKNCTQTRKVNCWGKLLGSREQKWSHMAWVPLKKDPSWNPCMTIPGTHTPICRGSEGQQGKVPTRENLLGTGSSPQSLEHGTVQPKKLWDAQQQV